MGRGGGGVLVAESLLQDQPCASHAAALGRPAGLRRQQDGVHQVRQLFQQLSALRVLVAACACVRACMCVCAHAHMRACVWPSTRVLAGEPHSCLLILARARAPACACAYAHHILPHDLVTYCSSGSCSSASECLVTSASQWQACSGPSEAFIRATHRRWSRRTWHLSASLCHMPVCADACASIHVNPHVDTQAYTHGVPETPDAASICKPAALAMSVDSRQ